jgi:hypothetical protein
MFALIATLLAQGYVAEMTSFGGELTYCPGLNASIDAYHGIATGGPIFPNASGLGLELVGRRRDQVAQVSIQSEVFVDGGVQLSVNAPRPCNFSAPPMFAVTNDGVYYGWAFNPDCSNNSDVFAGSWVDASGVAGHISFRAADRNQLTIAGALAANHDAMLEGGDRPNPTLYPPGVVCTETDGGTFFCYAGNHGSTTLTDTTQMHAGVVVQFDNLDHPTTRHRAGIEAVNGAYFQSHGLSREQFDSPVQFAVMVNDHGAIGQFTYFRESRLLYAFDTHHWYFANGEQWVQLAEQSSVEARLIALEARVTALETR